MPERGGARGGRVVITGVATHWGTELARALERDPSITYLAGVDTAPPESDLERTEFIEADIRNPVISRVLPSLEPDVVVHCGIVWYPQEDLPARSLHDVNVIGTLQLLAACEKVDGLRAVIARGSAAIYGSEADAPSFFREDMARRFPLKTRFQRDIGELEDYFDNFARRNPSVTCCMLRYQPEVGPGLDQPISRYLSLPVVPVQLGFDPRLQLIHEVDATGALARATVNPARGAVNVAPDGAISLSHVLRLSGRPAVPLLPVIGEPLIKRIGEALGAADLYNDGRRLFKYGRGCDNRRLREEIGYEPAFDAEGAVRDFAAKLSASRALVATPTPGRGARHG